MSVHSVLTRSFFQMFSDIRKAQEFTMLIEPNSTLTLSPGKGTDMQAQDPYWANAHIGCGDGYDKFACPFLSS